MPEIDLEKMDRPEIIELFRNAINFLTVEEVVTQLKDAYGDVEREEIADSLTDDDEPDADEE